MTIQTNFFVDKWKSLPWKSFDNDLFQLQHKIYKATKKGDLTCVKKLQRLIFRSAAARYLAVKQVTQFNIGNIPKKMPRCNAFDCKQRLLLAEKLHNLSSYSLHIPTQDKSHGKLNRPLSRLTMDAMQYIIKYALEPVYKAQASRDGFELRSAWGIQHMIYKNLQFSAKGYEKVILELDIKKGYKMDHNKLMCLVPLPQTAKKMLWSILRAGIKHNILDDDSILGPLLCNIALNGIEELVPNTKNSNQTGFRHGHHIIFFLNPDQHPSILYETIDKFLAQRGLHITKRNIRLIKSIEGFDFLGMHFKVKTKNKKFVCYPSANNRRQMIKKIKTTMKDTRFTLDQRLNKVKSIYQNWTHTHQYCDLKQINLWSINTWTNLYLIKNSDMKRQLRIKKVKQLFSGHRLKVNDFKSTVIGSRPFIKC